MLWLLALAVLTIVLLSRALHAEDRTIVMLLHTLDQVTDDAARWRMLAERFESDCKVWLQIVADRNIELEITRVRLEDEMQHNEGLILQLATARRTRDGYKLLWQQALHKEEAPAPKPVLALAK